VGLRNVSYVANGDVLRGRYFGVGCASLLGFMSPKTDRFKISELHSECEEPEGVMAYRYGSYKMTSKARLCDVCTGHCTEL
jgi:hypothetical protein